MRSKLSPRLRRQVETSNSASQRILPPTTYPSGTGGIISNTPFTSHFQLLRQECALESFMDQGITMLAHQRTQNTQSRCVPCMAVRMWIQLDRIRGSSSQAAHNPGWQSRPGQSVPAFPGSRIVPIRRIDSRDTANQRMLKFGTSKVPKLTKVTLVTTI
jgi:hypothetical protein